MTTRLLALHIVLVVTALRAHAAQITETQILSHPSYDADDIYGEVSGLSDDSSLLAISITTAASTAPIVAVYARGASGWVRENDISLSTHTPKGVGFLRDNTLAVAWSNGDIKVYGRDHGGVTNWGEVASVSPAQATSIEYAEATWWSIAVQISDAVVIYSWNGTSLQQTQSFPVQVNDVSLSLSYLKLTTDTSTEGYSLSNGVFVLAFQEPNGYKDVSSWGPFLQATDGSQNFVGFDPYQSQYTQYTAQQNLMRVGSRAGAPMALTPRGVEHLSRSGGDNLLVLSDGSDLPNRNLTSSYSVTLVGNIVWEWDADNDGVLDGHDNCEYDANTAQTDADQDGWGDACDTCPAANDPDQNDSDNDGVGDVCDVCPGSANNVDVDADSVCDDVDNCLGNANPTQADRDNDGVGDACDVCPGDAADTDTDDDGICDVLDNCPTIANEKQIDSNGNGAGDACDLCDGDRCSELQMGGCGCSSGSPPTSLVLLLLLGLVRVSRKRTQ